MTPNQINELRQIEDEMDTIYAERVELVNSINKELSQLELIKQMLTQLTQEINK